MKRRYAIASLAVMAANLKLSTAKAQTQVISNSGQVVSTGDVVIRQSAGGYQEVWNPATGTWQAVSNDLQVVNTGNVTVDQSAAGTQSVSRDPATWCTPGKYSQDESGCILFCTDDCHVVTFCCNSKKRVCCR